MLLCLKIRNFAIIEELDLDFERGMGVLTGETGAGKSIIIDALGLVLGGRAYSEYIRSGAGEARVEALFDISKKPELNALLDQKGLAEGDQMVISRTISLKGANRASVNGRMVPVAMLGKLTSRLVDIYGQHEHHSLLDPESHLDMLDRFGDHGALLERYRAAWRSMRETKRRIEDATHSESERASRLDYLKFVINEIDTANPENGELESLREERDVLRNARQLREAAGGAYETLYGTDGSAAERISEVAENLKRAGALDPRLARIGEAIDSARYAIEEAAADARDYAETIEENQAKLEEIEDRLDALGKLVKKYGGSLDAVIEHRDKYIEEAERLQSGEMSLDELKKKLDIQLKETGKLAKQLSAKRKETAKRLSREVKRELDELGMPDTRFEVVFAKVKDNDGLGPEGAETGEFHLSTNVGEEPRPLVKIASGGELSRIMLSLKNVMSDSRETPTLIFDEVDSGIGGAAAEVVGRKLKSLSKNSQVLCVTHLAQIAAFAQTHYFVSKTARKKRTVTEIERLDTEKRTNEIARMLGGADVTNATITLAGEMLSNAGD